MNENERQFRLHRVREATAREWGKTAFEGQLFPAPPVTTCLLPWKTNKTINITLIFVHCIGTENLSQYKQLPRSTQPGHPSVDRSNEYQPQGGGALRLGSKGMVWLVCG